MDTPMIDIKNLQRQLGRNTIIKNIQAQVNAGEAIALLGKNGAGKTTLLETILGFGFPTAGEVNLWGVAATDIKDSIKQRIGFVPQQDELISTFNGSEHIDLFKAFRHTWNQPLVERLVAEWSIPLDIVVTKMSVGQRQKLSILLAIAHEPPLLVLDEPVASLDPVARRQFLQQLVDIAADENRAVIFSTHIVSDVERVANKVWMLRDGELVYQGGLDELKESVVRITLHANEDLPKNLQLPHTLKQNVHGSQAQITLAHWCPDMQARIEEKFSARMEISYLSLEDIFLEMNK